MSETSVRTSELKAWLARLHKMPDGCPTTTRPLQNDTGLSFTQRLRHVRMKNRAIARHPPWRPYLLTMRKHHIHIFLRMAPRPTGTYLPEHVHDGDDPVASPNPGPPCFHFHSLGRPEEPVAQRSLQSNLRRFRPKVSSEDRGHLA